MMSTPRRLFGWPGRTLHAGLRGIAFCGLAALVVPARAADRLPPAVEAALARAHLPSDAVVAMVQEVGAARPRLTWQVTKPVNPASLTKLFTTSAGLDLLGPAFTWSTPVWLRGTVQDGVLDGDLVIKGTGDPKLVVERIGSLLRRVQQLGVREIRGDMVLDRTSFVVPERSPAAFDGEGLRPYNVQADALMLNFRSVVLTFWPDVARGLAVISAEPPLAGVPVDASVPLSDAPCDDWHGGLRAAFADPTQLRFSGNYPGACAERTWAVAYADPPSFDARALLGLWQQLGGRLGGVVRDGAAPSTPPSFEATSASLAETVRDINKFSNNVMAQQLFLTLGLRLRGTGSPEAARDVLRQWASERFGAAADGMVIDNGSGLSRETRVSARLLTRLLQAAWAGPSMPELMSSLPISGVDGTLRDARVLIGRAHLKTGSLRDVSGIAGYVLADSGRRYVVVAVANHADASAARPAFDALTQWVASDLPTRRSGRRTPSASRSMPGLAGTVP